MLALSKIIAGTMNWGLWDKKLDSSAMSHLIKLFSENQVTTFDLADIYGGYTTEKAFGEAFAKSGLSRKEVQFITKCGIQYVCEQRPNRVKHYDYRKQYIIDSVETSLKHLKTDFVEVLLLHRPSPLMESEEIAEAVSSLLQEGKILSFGVSNFTASQTALLQKKIKIDYNQIQFSATNTAPMLDGTLDYMQLHHIKPMAWNPLGAVFRENTEQTRRLKNVLARMVDQYGAGADLILLAWIMKHPAKILPVAGTVNPGRIQQLHKAASLIIDNQDWFEIWSESMGSRVP
jgi:predicted oxidoreductase